MDGPEWGDLERKGRQYQNGSWQSKPFGAISALAPYLWGAEELVLIGPEKAPTGPGKGPICPEKARFYREDFPPIFSGKSKWGLSKWRLKVLVHNCPRLSSFCAESSP